jgi:hypothetical protein
LNEAPPPLVLRKGTLSEGDKVQAKWLFEFLHRPHPIRPWLQIRMPTFNIRDTDVAGLASYFVAEVPFEFVPPVEELNRKMVEAGRILVSEEYCLGAHPSPAGLDWDLAQGSAKSPTRDQDAELLLGRGLRAGRYSRRG